MLFWWLFRTFDIILTTFSCVRCFCSSVEGAIATTYPPTPSTVRSGKTNNWLLPLLFLRARNSPCRPPTHPPFRVPAEKSKKKRQLGGVVVGMKVVFRLMCIMKEAIWKHVVRECLHKMVSRIVRISWCLRKYVLEIMHDARKYSHNVVLGSAFVVWFPRKCVEINF